MRFSLAIDEFHRLVCRFDDDAHSTSAESADAAVGLEALAESLDALESDGFGECFWFTAAGEYRWVMRRHQPGLVRLAVLWCGSIAVGFQHVVWQEMPLLELVANLRTELARIALLPAASARPGRPTA